MAFTVEDGSGVEGANAYETIAEVTAYLTDRGRAAENGWSTASASTQQAAIVKATDYAEKRFGPRFVGEPASDTQGLSFPREGGFDSRLLRHIADDEIPKALKQAIAEYSVRSLDATLLPDPAGSASGHVGVVPAVQGKGREHRD